MAYTTEIFSCYKNGRVSGFCFSSDFSLELMSTVIQCICNYCLVGGLVSYMCVSAMWGDPTSRSWKSLIYFLSWCWEFRNNPSRVRWNRRDYHIQLPTQCRNFYHSVSQRFLSYKSCKKWLLHSNQACAYWCTYISEKFTRNDTYPTTCSIYQWFNFILISSIIFWSVIDDIKYMTQNKSGLVGYPLSWFHISLRCCNLQFKNTGQLTELLADVWSFSPHLNNSNIEYWITLEQY